MLSVVFRLDEQRFALPLASVSRAVCAAEVTPLPGAPDAVLGVVNMHGRAIPVFNIRRRFRLPEVTLGPEHYFLVVQTAARMSALVVDGVEDVIEHPVFPWSQAEETMPGFQQFTGILKMEDGLVLIHDLDTFLSRDDVLLLDEVLERVE